jgi:erythromycin esterase-like protein
MKAKLFRVLIKYSAKVSKIGVVLVLMLLIVGNDSFCQINKGNFPDFGSKLTSSSEAETYIKKHFETAIGDSVKLVALGEVSHGGYEPMAFKAHMVKFLVEKKGFRKLLIEGPDQDISKMRNYLNSREALDTSFINKWVKDRDLNESSSAVYRELFYLLKAYNLIHEKDPVEVAGFDIGINERFLNFILYRYIIPYNQQEAQKFIQMSGTARPVNEQIGYLANWFNLNRKSLEGKLGKPEFDWLSSYIRTAVNSLEYEVRRGDNSVSAIITANLFRDSVLSENVQYLAKNVKSIVWTHNAHAVAAGFKNMGNLLRERYGNSYYIIATDFPKVASVDILDNKSSKVQRSFTADPSSAARKLLEKYNISEGIFSRKELKDMGINGNTNVIDAYGLQFVITATENIIDALVVFSNISSK